MGPQVPEGFLARYSHHRRYKKVGDTTMLDPRGGATECFLMRKQEDGSLMQVARGRADCSRQDNYEKRIGRIKSLGRAIADLKRVHESLVAKQEEDWDTEPMEGADPEVPDNHKVIEELSQTLEERHQA